MLTRVGYAGDRMAGLDWMVRKDLAEEATI